MPNKQKGKVSKPKLSQRRMAALQVDIAHVERLYHGACARFGTEQVQQDLRLVWTWRCMQGVMDILPFEALESRALSELLYVARELCGFGKESLCN